MKTSVCDKKNCLFQEATSKAQRDNTFRAHPFYQMDVVLKEGRDLVIRDSCGK